jgi:hypothetical protein
MASLLLMRNGKTAGTVVKVPGYVDMPNYLDK